MTRHKLVSIICLIVLLAAFGCGSDAAEGQGGKAGRAYGRPKLLARIANPRITESSGVACSRRNKDVFWTHNDSGDHPYVYAFNGKGEDLGTWELDGARHRDWEDMCAFTMDGKHWLLVADTGDNAKVYKYYTIYLVEEPEVDAKKKQDGPAKLAVARTIHFNFEGGSKDGEAVAFDARTKTVYFADRTRRAWCRVFRLKLPEKDEEKELVAEQIARVDGVAADAMDIAPGGKRAVIGTYGDAFEFTRRPKETWAKAFSRKPRTIDMPRRGKGESIAYGPEGKALYLTSEGRNSPLWKVPAVEEK
jgi:hypothetical protein